MLANLENSTVAIGLEKVSFHYNPKEGPCQRMFKYYTIALISHVSKIMAQNPSSYSPTVCEPRTSIRTIGFRNAEEPEIKLPTSVISKKKQENFKKSSTSASLTTLKHLTVWITTNCGKFLKRWKYQITLSVYSETCMQVKKQQLELDMEQRMVQNWEWSKYVKAVYCHPDYLTYMQSISHEMPGWMKHKPE